jgi:integrase
MAGIAFTDVAIKAVPAPASGRVEITDSRCPGLVLRITDKDVRTFAFKFRTRGRGVIRLTLGRYPAVTLARARSVANQHRQNVANGADPLELPGMHKTPRGAMLFEDLAPRYIDEYAKPRKASWKNDEHYLKRPRKKWAGRAAASITDDDAADLLNEIAKTAPVSANRTQSVLHKLFAWAKEPGRKHVTINPLADMPRRAREKPKERVLSAAELRVLWNGMDDPQLPTEPVIALALKAILLTAARPGEVAGMTRAELQRLDGENPEWHLPGERTKNRRPHIVPLSPLAVAVIKQSMPEGEPVAFPSKWGRRASIARHSLSQATIEIVSHLKMVPFTPHDLRRTAATLAREGSVPRDYVTALLNHTRSDITRVYDTYEMLSEKREAVSVIAQRVHAIVR